MKVLVLFEELSGYFLACLNAFVKDGNEVTIVHKKVNEEAPFIIPDHFDRYEREGIDDLEKWYATKTFDGILCGGWTYKPYLKVCRSSKGKIPVVLAFDNLWKANLKQTILTKLSKRYFRNRFDFCFVPGSRQKEFALKIGFNQSEIVTGFYCCDFDCFDQAYEKRKSVDRSKKILLYMGRYVDLKGLNELWSAFVNVLTEDPDIDWELWCVGTGPLEKVEHQNIKHLGFKQPKELEEILVEASAVVMPSKKDNWGMVLHEVTTAGLPVLVSDRVVAIEAFVQDGENGWIFDPLDESSIENALKRLFELNGNDLLRLGEASRELSKNITLESWVSKLTNFFTNNVRN
ncbi:MAG: glycosyltransferase family 4 protein [Flavobacteriales bacterium]|nr:glycosyltransferase family 4 protein [Flavobacteriales bacterium]